MKLEKFPVGIDELMKLDKADIAVQELARIMQLKADLGTKAESFKNAFKLLGQALEAIRRSPDARKKEKAEAYIKQYDTLVELINQMTKELSAEEKRQTLEALFMDLTDAYDSFVKAKGADKDTNPLVKDFIERCDALLQEVEDKNLTPEAFSSDEIKAVGEQVGRLKAEAEAVLNAVAATTSAAKSPGTTASGTTSTKIETKASSEPSLADNELRRLRETLSYRPKTGVLHHFGGLDLDLTSSSLGKPAFNEKLYTFTYPDLPGAAASGRMMFQLRRTPERREKGRVVGGDDLEMHWSPAEIDKRNPGNIIRVTIRSDADFKREAGFYMQQVLPAMVAGKSVDEILGMYQAFKEPKRDTRDRSRGGAAQPVTEKPVDTPIKAGEVYEQKDKATYIDEASRLVEARLAAQGISPPKELIRGIVERNWGSMKSLVSTARSRLRGGDTQALVPVLASVDSPLDEALLNVAATRFLIDEESMKIREERTGAVVKTGEQRLLGFVVENK